MFWKYAFIGFVSGQVGSLLTLFLLDFFRRKRGD